jgi:hypothetical protein
VRTLSTILPSATRFLAVMKGRGLGTFNIAVLKAGRPRDKNSATYQTAHVEAHNSWRLVRASTNSSAR